MERLIDWSGADAPRTYSEVDGKVLVSQDGETEELPCSFEEVADFLKNEQDEHHAQNERSSQMRGTHDIYGYPL